MRKVFRNDKVMKRKENLITESFTRTRMDVVIVTIEKFGLAKVWTSDGEAIQDKRSKNTQVYFD